MQLDDTAVDSLCPKPGYERSGRMPGIDERAGCQISGGPLTPIPLLPNEVPGFSPGRRGLNGGPDCLQIGWKLACLNQRRRHRRKESSCPGRDWFRAGGRAGNFDGHPAFAALAAFARQRDCHHDSVAIRALKHELPIGLGQTFPRGLPLDDAGFRFRLFRHAAPRGLFLTPFLAVYRNTGPLTRPARGLKLPCFLHPNRPVARVSSDADFHRLPEL